MGTDKKYQTYLVTDIKIHIGIYKKYIIKHNHKMGVIVYMSNVSSSLLVKKHIEKIVQVLDAKKIPHECIDISIREEDKLKMREIAGPKSVVPQIANGDVYCGDFELFNDAVEDGTLNAFLKLE